ncbi:SCP-like protein [Necator americanus]|nr:SCP-like protein [Necator americanus]ETN82145.1 SCP-like protein [Necator americanus]
MTTGMARQASKMIKLTYNCALEKSAFEYAMQCKDADSGYSSENRYTFPNTALTMDVIARRAPNRWWLEIENTGMDQNADLNKFYAKNGVSHWARMAWDSNKSVGCAAYKCPNFINAICRYESGGTEAEQIYKMGPACRRCTIIGTEKCEEGLCVF